jgi:hypothetical protein
MDGLSVAASVAGIISLGIQVTQFLIDFYEAYKGQKSDITNTAKSWKISSARSRVSAGN